MASHIMHRMSCIAYHASHIMHIVSCIACHASHIMHIVRARAGGRFPKDATTLRKVGGLSIVGRLVDY